MLHLSIPAKAPTGAVLHEHPVAPQGYSVPLFPVLCSRRGPETTSSLTLRAQSETTSSLRSGRRACAELDSVPESTRPPGEILLRRRRAPGSISRDRSAFFSRGMDPEFSLAGSLHPERRCRGFSRVRITADTTVGFRLGNSALGHCVGELSSSPTFFVGPSYDGILLDPRDDRLAP